MSVLSLIGLVQVSGTLVLDSAGKLALLPEGVAPRVGDVIIDVLENAEIENELSVQLIQEDGSGQNIVAPELDAEQIIAQIEAGDDPSENQEQAPAAGELQGSSLIASGSLLRENAQTIAQTQFDTTGLEAQGLNRTQSLVLLQFLSNSAPVTFNQFRNFDEESQDNLLSLALPTDANNDQLTIRVTSLPLLGAITLGDGSEVSVGDELTLNELANLQYDAPSDYQDGEEVGSLDYTVDDGRDAPNSVQSGGVEITLNEVNDAPVAYDDGVNTDEDSVLNGVLPEATDVDGTVNAYALLNDIPEDKGDLTFNADGTYSFNPGNDFQQLTDGQTEDVTFTYVAIDNEGLSSEPQTITITVTGTNDKPVAVPADEMTNEDTSITRDVPQGSDVDGTVASYALATDVPDGKGSLSFNNGTYTFDPGEDFQDLTNGQTEDVTFTYVAIDNEGLSSEPQTITITVTGTNDKPVALPADEMTNEDTSITRDVPEASDVDGTVASYALATDVPDGKGSLSFNNGTYTFEPGEDFQGLTDGQTEDVTFTYVAIDNEGLSSAPQTITITVTGTNDKPVALPADEMTNEDTSITRDVPEGSDVDGTVASYALATDVPDGKGSLSFNNGTYTFNPGNDFQGLTDGQSENVTFTYVAIDNEGLASEPQTITITVTGTNDKPVALPADEMTDEDTSITRDVP
ncbi:tandem-95 repeat protein, partial [Vibrio sp. E150_011]